MCGCILYFLVHHHSKFWKNNHIKSSLFTLYRIRSYPDEEKTYYVEADLEDLKFITSKSGPEGSVTRLGVCEYEPQYPCVWTCTLSGNQLVFTWHSNHDTDAFLFSNVSSGTLVNMFDLKVVTNLMVSNLFQYFKGCLLEHRNFWLHSQDVLYCRMACLNILQQKLIAFLVSRPVFAVLISYFNLCW